MAVPTLIIFLRPYILRVLDENSRRVQVESSRPSKRRRLHDELESTSEIIYVESTAFQDSSTPTHSEQAESDTPNSNKKDIQSARRASFVTEIPL